MSFLTDLVAIRDATAAELKAEMTRRAALVAAGEPPPTDYSFGGKSVQWNAYLKGMTDLIREQNEMVVMMGAEGIPEETIKLYT